MADTGRTNLFRIFQGRYEITPTSNTSFTTKTVMLSCTNDVQVLGDCNLSGYTGGNSIGTLPPECRPDTIVKIPVIVSSSQEPNQHEVLTVNPNGTMTLLNNHTIGRTYLSGINFNISDRWYA